MNLFRHTACSLEQTKERKFIQDTKQTWIENINSH